ncbi:MAG: trypsin-like peptidase domain-containing protein [Phycisphaeraceae bacterium JB051]
MNHKLLSLLMVLSLTLPTLAQPKTWQKNPDSRMLRRTPVVEVFENSKDAVVNIASKQVIQYRSPLGIDDLFDRFFDSPFRRRQPRSVERTSVGSGFVLHKSGLIVTNAHVVAQTAERKVIFNDHQEYDAQIIAIDHEHDLAVLKIDVDHDIQTLPLGHSDDLIVGETVIAIGNALGYQHTVTSGVVSALNRSIDINDDVAFKNLIQTDASINPGNSGGPLLNVLGELVGINTAIRADGQNIGFAIPVDDLRRLLPQMLALESRSRLQVGMQVSDRGNTLKITRIDVDSPADKAGLQVADVITQIDGKDVTNAVDYTIAMVGKKADDFMQVTVKRGHRNKTYRVQIVEKPRPDLDTMMENLFGMQVGIITDEMAREARLRIRGLAVIKTLNNGPAAKLGIQRGDIITNIGNLSTTDTNTLAEQLENISPGDRLRITIVRIANRSYIRKTLIITAR